MVRINGCDSEHFPMSQGVKQGDTHSPLLFINFTDEIHKICKSQNGKEEQCLAIGV